MSVDRVALLRSALQQALEPTLLEIRDDSAAHAGHAGAREGGHFFVLIASPRCDEALRDAWRALSPAAGEGAVSLLPGVLVARWLGPACEPGRQWFTRLWATARPAVAGRAAHTPRIWNT